jgi:hypothetical protein
MALKLCSRSAVLRDSRRGIHTGTSPRGSHAHSACARVSAMDRGHRRARCSHSSSTPRRRPSPAASQPPPSGRSKRRCGAASVRPAAQESIAVSASIRAHTHMHARTNACTLSYATDRTHTHARSPMYTLHAHKLTPIRACTARTMLTFSFASTSAPFARSASTTSKWPP